MRNTPASWDERARAGGTSWEAASWSKRGQTVRFGAAYTLLLPRLTLLEETGQQTLLDYGCGTGSFCRMLPSYVDYVGFDWSPEMRARARREHARATVIDELDDDDRSVFDHVVCIGTFNLVDNWSKEKTWDVLEELWTQHTRHTLIVSLYRGTADGMIGYTPSECAELVTRLRARSFVVRSDYAPNDLMLGVFHEPDRHGSPAELPSRDVGRLQDPRV